MKCSTEMPRYLQYSDAITTGGPSVTKSNTGSLLTKSNTGSVPEEPFAVQ